MRMREAPRLILHNKLHETLRHHHLQMCEQRGGLVTRVSVRNQLDLFARAEQEVGME